MRKYSKAKMNTKKLNLDKLLEQDLVIEIGKRQYDWFLKSEILPCNLPLKIKYYKYKKKNLYVNFVFGEDKKQHIINLDKLERDE